MDWTHSKEFLFDLFLQNKNMDDKVKAVPLTALLPKTITKKSIKYNREKQNAWKIASTTVLLTNII